MLTLCLQFQQYVLKGTDGSYTYENGNNRYISPPVTASSSMRTDD